MSWCPNLTKIAISFRAGFCKYELFNSDYITDQISTKHEHLSTHLKQDCGSVFTLYSAMSLKKMTVKAVKNAVYKRRKKVLYTHCDLHHILYPSASSRSQLQNFKPAVEKF